MIWIVAYLSAGALIWVFRVIRDPPQTSYGRRNEAIVLALLLVAWPVIGVVFLWMLFRERWPAPERPPFTVRTQDLGEALSIDEIEARERVQDPLGAVPDLPFGHLNPAWARFKARLPPTVPMAAFSRVYGGDWAEARHEGYAEVRAGKPKRWFLVRIYQIER